MSRRAPRTLHDLCELYGGGHIRLECVCCSRVRFYRVHEIRDYFRSRTWDDRWNQLQAHFRCAICRGRPGFPQWFGGDRELPTDAEHSCLAPFGINPLAWALAAPRDREKLIKARR